VENLTRNSLKKKRKRKKKDENVLNYVRRETFNSNVLISLLLFTSKMFFKIKLYIYIMYILIKSVLL